MSTKLKTALKKIDSLTAALATLSARMSDVRQLLANEVASASAVSLSSKVPAQKQEKVKPAKPAKSEEPVKSVKKKQNTQPVKASAPAKAASKTAPK